MCYDELLFSLFKSSVYLTCLSVFAPWLAMDRAVKSYEGEGAQSMEAKHVV
jgi:hypothetical protein